MAGLLKNRTLLVLAIGLLAFAAYWIPPLVFDQTKTSEFAYYNHLADAFLNGHLYLASPADTHDLTQYNGRWYVPFPPLPAVLMMPWVALFGLEQFSVVLFATICGSINVVLIFLLLNSLARNGWTRLSTAGNLWLTVLFGLGCVHWYMAMTGTVWFLAQICAFTFAALAVWLTIERRAPWLAGAALGMAMAARPHMVFTWVLLLGITATHLARDGQPISWRALLRWAVMSAAPIVMIFAALLVYNWARFDNPLDFGYLTENVDPRFTAKLQEHGVFSPFYTPKNFWAMALAGPLWREELNFWRPDPEGMSILFTTPAIIYLIHARQRSWLNISGWAALILVMIPLLLYQTSGWVQFGYRYSLDFMTPIMVLLALAVGTRIDWPMRALILAGVVMNLIGVVWWLR